MTVRDPPAMTEFDEFPEDSLDVDDDHDTSCSWPQPSGGRAPRPGRLRVRVGRPRSESVARVVKSVARIRAISGRSPVVDLQAPSLGVRSSPRAPIFALGATRRRASRGRAAPVRAGGFRGGRGVEPGQDGAELLAGLAAERGAFLGGLPAGGGEFVVVVGAQLLELGPYPVQRGAVLGGAPVGGGPVGLGPGLRGAGFGGLLLRGQHLGPGLIAGLLGGLLGGGHPGIGVGAGLLDLPAHLAPRVRPAPGLARPRPRPGAARPRLGGGDLLSGLRADPVQLLAGGGLGGDRGGGAGLLRGDLRRRSRR